MAAGHADTFHHVRDFPYFELPVGMRVPLPEVNLFGVYHLQLTRFMVLQLVVCVLTFVIFRGLSRRVSGGQPVTGRWWNFWEVLALFIRDEVVLPIMGEDGRKYMPYLLTVFFFILFSINSIFRHFNLHTR